MIHRIPSGLLLLFVTTAPAQVELIGPPDAKGDGQHPALTEHAVRLRAASFDPQSLLRLASPGSDPRPATPASARFTLFDDAVATVVFDRVYRDADDRSVVWSGLINGDRESSAAVAVTDDVTVGQFRFSDGRGLELIGFPNGAAFIREAAPAKGPFCATSDEPTADLTIPADKLAARAVAEQLALEQSALDDGRVLDKLVYYTPAAAVWAGGEAAVRSRILAANEEANRSLASSHVDLEFQIVSIQGLPYFEQPLMEMDLNALALSPLVAVARDAVRADVVHLIERSPDNWCGLARLPAAAAVAAGFGHNHGFAISQMHCLRAGDPTYQHEVGHTMGLHHDPMTRARQGHSAAIDPPFAQGYAQTAVAPHFSDIMAYPCSDCERINIWSNPFLRHGSEPTGIPDLYDTAGYISLYKHAVTNYRVSGRGSTLSDVAEMIEPRPGSTLSTGATTFRWRPRPSGFYQLKIGTEGPGSANIFDSSRLGLPELTVTLPRISGRMYADLRTWDGTQWHSRSYEYSVAGSPGGGVDLTATPVTDCASPRTTLSWNASGKGEVQIRVGSAAGQAMTGWEPEKSQALSGPWVRAGMIFVLVDRSGSELARVTPEHHCGGDDGDTPDPDEKRFTASPVIDCDSPTTLLEWSAPGSGRVQIRIGSATGQPMTGWENETGAARSGPWVSVGMTFVLVDSQEREIARVVPENHCGVGQVEFTATPVTDCSNRVTRLSWRAPRAGEVQIRTSSVNGTAVTDWLSEVGSFTTGPWVMPGTAFYLVQRSGNRELARVTPAFTCTPLVSRLWSEGIPPALSQRIDEVRADHKVIRKVVVTTSGGWLLLYGRNEVWAAGVPNNLFDKLVELYRNGDYIKDVAISPHGHWVVLINERGYGSFAVPALNQALSDLYDEGRRIDTVEYTAAGGWVVIFDGNGWRSEGLPNDILAAMHDVNSKGHAIKALAFSASSRVLVFGGNGYWQSGAPPNLLARMYALNQAGEPISDVMLGYYNPWTLISNASTRPVGRLTEEEDEEQPPQAAADIAEPTIP